MVGAERCSPPREEEEEEEGGEGGTQDPPGGGNDDDDDDGCPAPPAPPKKKRVVPGVLYLPFLPPGFGPRQARALLTPHGEVGRIFFQPHGGGVRKRRQRPGPPPRGGGAGSFAEGWVEFRDKRAAKRAAALLHGAPMAPRPRSPFRHHRWSIKYLPGFRWPHLSERLGYERQVRGQRLRAEVAQAKREGGFYTRPSPHLPTPPPPPSSSSSSSPPPPQKTWGFTQRRTEMEIWGRGEGKAPPPPSRRLLEKVWGEG